MQYIEGEDRNQSLLFPESIDEYVKEDNPVRFVEAFVDHLDLEDLGFKVKNRECKGRPAYNSSDLLKLYLYGYINRIRSSRRLEDETHRNVELMWLMRKLKPDFKTIADFRRDNRKVFKKTFRQFTLLCRKLDLFGKELVAIDGSKFKAVNSKARNYSHRVVKEDLERIDKKIRRYLNDLEEQDHRERQHAPLSREQLDEKIKYLTERKEKLENLDKSMQESGDLQVSLTDPDSRISGKHGKSMVGFNVQTAVDDKHKLIVACEVVSDVSDMHQLAPMAIEAKEELDADSITAVVDMGYYDGQQVKQCEEENIAVHMNKPDTSRNAKKGYYSKKHFRYKSDTDTYICPANNSLHYSFDMTVKGRLYRYYSISKTICRECPLKSKCYPGNGRKRINRSMEENILERMAERVKNNPEILARRKGIVEHCFGTMKLAMNQGYFLTRGLESVRGEMSLTALAYNMKRVINIVGVKNLIQAL